MNLIFLFLLSLPLAAFAFIFEVYPRVLNKSFGVDIWTHLLYLKEFHKRGRIPKEINNGFLIPGKYDYPPVFITILSKFSFARVKKYEFLFSPFFDFLHIILIFLLTFCITQSLFISFLTQLFYLLTPIIVLENSSATPRSLGYTLFTIVYFLLFYFSQTNQLYLLGIAIFFGALIFLSHRFTAQGFLFFSIFFSLFRKDPVYILVFVASFLLAIILSKGFYIDVLRGHLGNLIFWRKNIKFRFYHQIKGNYKDHKTKDFVFKMYNQFLKFPPFVLVITNPWTIFVFYFVFARLGDSILINNLAILVLLFYFLALLTIWVPSFRFLGEGQRYLELTSFPTSLIAAIVLKTLLESEMKNISILVFGTIGFLCFVTIIVIQRKAIIKDTLRTLSPDMIMMFNYLKGLKVKPKLICIPHQITTNTIFHTGCPVFVNADYKSIDKISDVYPYLKMPIEKVISERDLDMILLNEEYASIEDLKMSKPKVVKRFGNFALLRP